MSTRLILATLAACLALAAPAGAAPVLPTAQFDPDETAWLSYRDLTSSQFAAKFAALKDDHMVVDLEVDVIDGAYRVGAVFRKNPDGRGWASLRNLTHDEFHERWEDYRDRGFRLVDQETYVHQGDRLYAGVWIENREGYGWASYRNVSSAEFSQRFALYRDRGFLPIDVEVYPFGDGFRYGAIWVENRESLAWKLRRGLTSSQYADAFEGYADDGLRSLDVEPVQTDDGRRYAGIWIENRNGRAWAAVRDLTATGFRNRWNRYADKGFRLDGYEKYDTSGGARYAGIWRQNGERWDWPLRTGVDEKVDTEFEEFDPPGVSVAVALDGELVYLGGRGHQDVEDGVWMHSGTVGRIASVSKAVAGTLAMRMLQKHPSLDLGDPVRDRDHLPQLPVHHTYTVGDTLSNRSCVDHYPDGFTAGNQTHYDTALDVVEEFMDQELVCTPGQYKYSTHAYTVFAAVLEQLEGKSADRIALDELSTPFGLKTLRTENLASGLPDRATLYRSSGAEHTGDDTSNKWYGGGFVSSARDLTRFGMGILDGTILTEDQRETMWGLPGYAYGWQIETAAGGQRMMSKAGSQPGGKAYLRVYPDDGLVVSVLMNSDGGDYSTGRLSREIGELVLAEL